MRAATLLEMDRNTHEGVFLTVPEKFIEPVYFFEESYFESAVPFHSCMAVPDKSDESGRNDTGRKTYHSTLTSVSVLREFISEGVTGLKLIKVTVQSLSEATHPVSFLLSVLGRYFSSG